MFFFKLFSSSIDRYLRNQGCEYSMKKSSAFQTSQGVIKTKRKLAKQAGLGNQPNKALPLSPENEERLWTEKAMGSHSPTALLRALWFLLSKLFGMHFLSSISYFFTAEITDIHDFNLMID